MRKCISCNIGCADHRIARSRPLRCSINPDIIHGDAYKQQRVIRDTNVVVIGAGTAGMEAACTAAEVGCHTAAGRSTASADWPADLPAAGEKAYR